MTENWNAAGQPYIGELKVIAPGGEAERRADERVSIPLDAETALTGLLRVDPHTEPRESKP